jgi:hypothetical protein
MSPPKTPGGRQNYTLAFFAASPNRRLGERIPRIEKLPSAFLVEPVDASLTAKWTGGSKS